MSLDWAHSSTLMALGCPPVGAAETGAYANWVVYPALPATVRDVGLRLQPNLEWVAALRPDLILIGPLTETHRGALERIAPVWHASPFGESRDPLAQTAVQTVALGRHVGRETEARAFVVRAQAAFDAAAATLAPSRGRGALLATLSDDRHVMIHGRGSLFGDVLARVGLRNAWDRPTTIWGTSQVGIEALADFPEADLAILEPVPEAARGALVRPGLWRSLSALRRGRFATLPPAWIFGDLVAATRFAGLVAAAWGGPVREPHVGRG